MEAWDLKALFDAWAPRLLAYMMTMTRDRSKAEDALQNLFVKLVSVKAEPQHLDVYLFRAARNEALRISRRRPERSLADLEVLVGHSGSLGALELADATDQLPSDQQDVVLLHVFEGLTFRETADVLGIPPDTAASRFRYALERLRELLEP
jgi:RNA polymerase sigma-70 factor (ECF subfamily)